VRFKLLTTLEAIENSVDIELFIDGQRSTLYNNLIHQPPAQFSSSGDTSDSVYRVHHLSFIPEKQALALSVKHISTDCVYYAFEFKKDYFICPAFFANSLNLKNTAVLNVTNGSSSGYIYIFVKKNESLMNFLNDANNLIREYNFTLDGRDVFDLNSGNKEMVCFFRFDQNPLSEELDPLSEEWDQLSESQGSHTSPIFSLKHKYVFMPKSIVKAFSKKHQLYFIKRFTHSGTSFIHRESKSYLEIIGMISKLPNKEDPELLTVALGEIFDNTTYKRENYILESLEAHIQANYKTSREKKISGYYCSMIAILQSSGYGKSKLMERLGSKTPTFYSSLQSGAGFPRNSFFLTRLLKELDIIRKTEFYMSNYSTAVYVYILRIIFIILKNNKDNKILDKNFLFDDVTKCEPFALYKNDLERIFSDLFDEDLKKLCSHSKPIEFMSDRTLTLGEIDKFDGISLSKFTMGPYSTLNLEGDVVEMLKTLNVKSSGLPAIFVIDEAKGLRFKDPVKDDEKYFWSFTDYNVKSKQFQVILERSPYNVFRRTFRMFTVPWEFLMLIIISTSGQISVLLPELDMDPSRREATSLKFIPNFTLVQTYNVNAKDAKSIHSKMFPFENISDWNQFLNSKFRIEEFFKFGRPLIYGTFVKNVKKALYSNAGDYKLDETLENCEEFSFLSKKLFGGKLYEATTNMSILFAMFNFAFGVNFLIPHISKEDLIENYLMTLVTYLVDKTSGKGYLAACYLPEGAFNALSAIYFAKNPNSLHEVLVASIKYGICDSGNLGELLAQYILLRTSFMFIDEDIQKTRKLIFQPIYLYNFLKHLAKEKESAIEEFFIENPEFEESRISFSYFEPFLKNPIAQPYDLMARCIFKGSALTLNSRYPGIDLMIPLILKDGKISFLGIQVKFVSQSGVADAKSKAIEGASFSRIFPQTAEGSNDRPFAIIVLVLGNYKYGEEEGGGIVSLYREPRDQLYEKPSILIFEGIPKSFDSEARFFKMAPLGYTLAYRGINPDYFKACDRLQELTIEGDDIVDVTTEHSGDSMVV
jgi:hypothetical protein